MSVKMLLLGLLPSLLYQISSAGEVSLRQARSAGEIDDRRVVCYYANWAVYRKGDAKFTPQNINPYLCTHLIYAFGGLGRDDSIVPFDEYQDIEKGGYGRFAALKTYNKDLKTLLAIGGWNEGSRRFSPLVADPDRRQVFIKSAIRFLRQYNFDGLDLDWEYPTQRQGGRPQDKENYAILIKEMREAFESESKQTRKPRLLISMAVPASLKYAGEGYAISSLSRDLDWFNLLTYDYHSAQEPAANHHAPLYKPDEWSDFDFRVDLNIDATIKFYLKHGASRDKLVLGIPTYGRSYSLANPEAHEVGSPALGPGAAGQGTKEDGYLAYYEICDRVLNDEWDLETPFPGIMGPYAHKGDQWVGFDDVDMAVEKAFYVAEEGLGGIMFWTIDNDDFRGTCGKTPYPLIESAKEAMFSVQSSVQTKTSVSVSTSEQTSVTRLRLTPQELASLATSADETPVRRPPKKSSRPSPPQRQDSPRSLSVVTTPEPPTTPSSGPDFKCRGEGFFPHPISCKKYYWCLDTPSQGMVAHTFSCPKGLYFNEIIDGCDFLKNVNCGDKEIKETVTDKSTQSPSTLNEIAKETDDEDNDVKDPKFLSKKDILAYVQAQGGVEGLQKQIEEKERSDKEEEDRRVNISSKTRNRLSQLLKGGADKAERKESENSDNKRQRVVPTLPRRQSVTSRAPPSTRSSFLSRLANRRKTTSAPLPDRNKINNSFEKNANEEVSSTPSSTSSLRRKSSLFRNRFRFSSNKDSTKATTTSPPTTSVSNLRSRFRNLLSRKPPSSSTISTSTTTSTTTQPLLLDTTQDPLVPNSENDVDEESGGRLQIVGAHLEPEEPEDQALHLGIFKPKAGVREKLRETLHTVLEHEMVERQKEKELEDLEQSTTPPISTVTISANTRVEEAKQRGDEVRASAGRRRLAGNRLRAKAKQRGSSRFVSKLRGRTRGKVQRTEDVENQVLIDDNNKQVVTEADEHDTDVHDLIQEHHPEIHFRHLQPDLITAPAEMPRISENNGFLLPTRLPIPENIESEQKDSNLRPVINIGSEFEITTLSTPQVDVTYKSFLPTVAQIAIEVTKQTTTEDIMEETTKNPVRRRKKVKRKQRRKQAIGEPIRSRTRLSEQRRPLKRVSPTSGSRRRIINRQRSQTVQRSNKDITTKSTEIHRPERLRKTRPRSRLRTSTEPTIITTSFSAKTLPPPLAKSEDEVKFITPNNEETTSKITTSTEEYINITPQENKDTTFDFLNEDSNNLEVSTETTTEEVSTLHPGKFKPKFGSNKLREKLRRELESLREKEKEGEINDDEKESEDSDNSSNANLAEDIDEATTAKVSYKSNFKRFDFKKSLNRKGRKRSLSTLKRRKLVKKLKRRPNVGRNNLRTRSLEGSLLRKRREDPSEHSNSLNDIDVKPFLLKGGKGYKSMLQSKSKTGEPVDIEKDETDISIIDKTFEDHISSKRSKLTRAPTSPSSPYPSPIQTISSSSSNRKLASPHRTLSLERRRRRRKN